MLKRCSQCNCQINVRPSRTGAHNYCSIRCRSLFRRRRRRVRCYRCRKTITRRLCEISPRNFCGRRCYEQSMKGHRNPRWKGGITSENHRLRNSPRYKHWRRAVFERDNYTCVWCGQRGGSLHADHIQQFASHPTLRFVVSNGRTLCVKCHKKTPSYLTTGKRLSPP